MYRRFWPEREKRVFGFAKDGAKSWRLDRGEREVCRAQRYEVCYCGINHLLEVWRYVYGVMRAGGLATLLRCLPAGAVSIMNVITVFVAEFLVLLWRSPRYSLMNLPLPAELHVPSIQTLIFCD